MTSILGQCRGQLLWGLHARPVRRRFALPGAQHEGLAWVSRASEALHGQPPSLIVDREGPIEALLDVDAGAGIAAAARPGEELEGVVLEADGVVVGHGAGVVEAADGVECGWRRCEPIGGLGLGRRLREALIEAGEEGLEDARRVVQRTGVSEAELLDEAILEGAKEALDAALIWYENVGCTLLMIGCSQLAAVLW
jgi:hypothetical protein